MEDKNLKDARERLYVSDRAHVVLQLHQKIDGLEEAELAGGKIGTTGKGIGPTYSTKMSRSGLRIADLFQEDYEKRIRTLAAGFKKRFGDLLVYDVEEELTNLKALIPQLAPMVCLKLIHCFKFVMSDISPGFRPISPIAPVIAV